MAAEFPYERNTDKFLRQLFTKQMYTFLALIFTKVMRASPYQVFQMSNTDGKPCMDWVRACEGTADTE